MKLLSLTTILLLSLFSFGQRVVALHSSGTVTMFDATTPFIAAYNAAQNGDTIYLPGGAFNAPSTIDKSLVIVGAGVHVDSTLATNPTLINNGFYLGDNADNIHIEGLDIPSLSIANNVSVNSFIIRRCKINGVVSMPGNLTVPSIGGSFIGNIITSSMNLDNLTSGLVANNLIQGNINDSHSNVFQNNSFINAGSSSYNVFEDCDNNTIENNVFSNTSYYWMSGTGNIVHNNVFEYNGVQVGPSTIMLGNYQGVPHADIYVDQTGSVLNFTDDYHLVYPATYLGNDGTQAGMYGGNHVFKEGAVPMNPHIRTATIAPTTNASGELNINIEVGAQDQ